MSVSPEREGVLALPGLSPASLGVVVSVALVDTSALLAGSGETTALAVLVDWVDDPVDAGIAADRLVLGVDKDDFVVLVGRILVDPVRVENAQVGASSANTLLSGRPERSLVLQLVHTLVGGLAISSTLWNWPLATSTANTDTVDDISLLSLVSETASLVWARWSRSTMDDR